MKKIARNGLKKCLKKYYYSIPSISSIIFLSYSGLNYLLKLGLYEVYDSKNFNEVFKSTITFISIIISFLGVLLTILISNKGKSNLIQYFFDNADKKKFASSLKLTIISGLAADVLSCLLLLNDIYLRWGLIILTAIWIWVLLYYLSNAYRFISLLLRLFLDDDTPNKKVKNEITNEDETNLKNLIKKTNEK
ncbi:hypothetical protein QA584_22460 [Anaerocolumna sp. AGMB13025]|uniref:hypothetical protein n=1 Tax=Anaerocolumna sp. AGMB13025 TaxID=3039116 RepID=UPI00241D632E|nr:hypothetical protein [Anaerocolumna sp. AGMB13025]WFR56351.1 hypothetical protein QA584_22460 [Anaerocolumna sp. AGMB13025]